MTLLNTSLREAGLTATRLQDLKLTIAGTHLEPVLEEFHTELVQKGITRLRPHCYLSTDWGVPFGTISVAIPFYLARIDLTRLHAERAYFVEGAGHAELLRYLRHEMGHVVNYAYQLYEREDWIAIFGSITQPYEEEYRPRPFSRDHVRHLPGWYAQKHPDEDWAETFAVWMTPQQDWRALYADWPGALKKLNYCEQLLAELRDRDPPVTATDPDEEVGTLSYSLEDFYGREPELEGELALPPGLDGALVTMFEDRGWPEENSTAPRLPAADLIRRLQAELPGNVFRWTGHLPERTQRLLVYLAERAEQLQQVYPADREQAAGLALATFVTALAMNHVHTGNYAP